MAYYSRAHICQCFTRLLTYRRNSVVAVTGNRVKTGEMLVREVLALASGLLELGFRPGDIVAICSFNSDWYLEWLLAVAFVGGIVAPLNYRWSFEEAKSAMSTVRPVMLVSDESCTLWYSKLCSNPIASLKWNVLLGSTPSSYTKPFMTLTMETLMKSVKEPLLLNYSWAPEATAIICFTSGLSLPIEDLLFSSYIWKQIPEKRNCNYDSCAKRLWCLRQNAFRSSIPCF